MSKVTIITTIILVVAALVSFTYCVSAMEDSTGHALVGTEIPYEGRVLVIRSVAEYSNGKFVLDAKWKGED